MDSERYKRGLEILKQLDSKVSEQLANLSEIAPEFAKYVVAFPFGDLCSRPEMDLKTREIVAVAALAALGYATPQLTLGPRSTPDARGKRSWRSSCRRWFMRASRLH